MKCPLCDVRLREVSRRGVMVDVCPDCKGVWLERGELEKLIEVAAEEEDYAAERTERPRTRDDDDERERHRRYEDEWRRRPEPYRSEKKKSSWLSQILEAAGGEGGD